MLLPEGTQQKGYAVASTLYPVLRVVMLPLSAVLLDAVGAAWLLVGQGDCPCARRLWKAASAYRSSAGRRRRAPA